MSRQHPPRLHRLVVNELDRVGLPWELRAGSKHWKLFLAGRLAVVISNGSGGNSDRRQTLNAVRAIRRVAKEANGCPGS